LAILQYCVIISPLFAQHGLVSNIKFPKIIGKTNIVQLRYSRKWNWHNNRSLCDVK